MKRLILVTFVAVAFSFFACKSEKRPEYTKENKVETIKKKSIAPFAFENANNSINFTAYKTTDKVAVGGQFKKVDIISGGEGNSIKEAVHNTEFSIPVSSIFTKDTSRDYKIKKFFFGVMDKTKLLSGKLVLENDSLGYANIKMNNVTQKVPFSYSINEKTFAMKATIDISNWNALEALNSLNTVCKDLHTGADGISKTWSEVALNITTIF